MIGAPVILYVLTDLADLMNFSALYKNTMTAFMICTCSLTGLAHIVNITVTRRLMAQGSSVPDYMRMDCWPSVGMAVDYLAWGFFLGLAFLSAGFAIKSTEKNAVMLKKTVTVCGMLCLTGFLGALYIDRIVWYMAPVSYGLGTIAICVQRIRIVQFLSERDILRYE